MSSNIRIIAGTPLDRRIGFTAGGITFDDDPANTGGASNPSVFSPTEIDGQLRGTDGANGHNVTISTQSSEGEAGDITLSTALTYSNTVTRSLTFNAARDVLIDADIIPSLLGAALNLSFNASSAAVNATSLQADTPDPAGHVAMGAGVTIDSNGGTISFSGAFSLRQSLQGTINSGGAAVTVGGGIDLAGDLAITSGAGGITINGGIDGAHDLALQAQGGTVNVNTGSIGTGTQLTGLGIAAASATFSSAINTGTVAFNLTGANSGVSISNAGALTIGSVGGIAGITTNTGNVFASAGGAITVADAISTVGTAAPLGMQVGNVALFASGNLTIQDTITGQSGVSGAGVTLSATGLMAINAAVAVLGNGTTGITAGGSGGTIALGADLTSDGGSITLSNATTLTAGTVTVDTDQTAGGNAGNVSFSSTIRSDVAGTRTLIVDARETTDGIGAAGTVSFGGSVGGAGRIGALGVGGAFVTFNNGSGGNNVGTLAVESSSANRGVFLLNAGPLTVAEVGPFSGIKTNSGTVNLLASSGDLTVSKAIDAVGTAAPADSGAGFQSGIVQLAAGNGNLTVSDTITGRGNSGISGVILSASGLITIGADVIARAGGTGGISIGGSGTTALGADLQSDGGMISLGNATTLAREVVTIDTDTTAGGNAGSVTFSSTIRSDVAGTRTLIVDARETTGGIGTDGTVSFGGSVGAAGRIGALGVGGAFVSFNNGSGGNNVGTIAVESSGANRGVFFINLGPLTIGDVGPFGGITTNSGTVNLLVSSGDLTISKAIDAVGTAAPADSGAGFQSGIVQLAASNGNLTVSDTITGRGHSGNPGVALSASGLVTIAAEVTALAGGTGGIAIGGAGSTALGADLQSDGGTISLSNATTLTAATVTIDTDRTAGGNAGSVTFSTGIQSDVAGTRTLIVDARETGAGAGMGGAVSFSGSVGGAGRVGALGVGGATVAFNNGSGGNNVGTLAVELSGANRGVFFLNSGSLTVGDVGPFGGIKANSGTVNLLVSSGDLTVASAIDAVGAATAGDSGNGFQSGMVQLTASSGNLTIADTITGRGNNGNAGVVLSTSGLMTILADVTALAGGTGGIALAGSGATALGADLQTDGGTAALSLATTLTTSSVTIDTDMTAGGTAGAITLSSTLNGNAANANTLIADARETGGGIGGQVGFNGLIGSGTRLAGLAVLGNGVSFNGGQNNAGTLAVVLTGANQALAYTNAAALTVGAVGPASGITTNTGNVTLTIASGALTVAQAINTIGAATASGLQDGTILLTAADGVTLNGPGDVTTAASFTVNADSNQNGGAYLQNAGAAVSAAAVQITASDVTLAGTIDSSGDVTFQTASAGAAIGVASTGSFALSDAELDTVSAAGTLTIGSLANTGGITIAASSALTQGAKNLQFTTAGAIAIGANNISTSGTVGLRAASIATGSGVIVAPALVAMTANGMALNTSADTLNLTNTASGNIAVNNTGAVSVSGSNTSGVFGVTAGGTLTTGGTVSAATAHLTGTSVALANAVTAGVLDLHATAGTITQTAAFSAGTLTGGSTGATALANAANAIGNLGPFSANGLTVVDGAGGLTIAGAVNAGTGAASIATTGNLAVNNTVDGNGATLIANSGTILLGANVNAHAGIAALQSAVTLTADAAVSGAGVNFSGAVDGGFGLTVSTAGTATFAGAVGGSTPLAALLANASAIALDGGQVATAGTQTYNGAVALGANTTLSGTTVTFASTVDANGFDLALDFSGTTAIDGARFLSLRNLSSGNGGSTSLTGTVSTSATQSYDDAVTLAGNTVATSSGVGASGDITFGATLVATVAGAQALTVNSAGTTSFGGAVGATALASLTTDAVGTTAIDGGSVTTTGAQSYNDKVTLGSDTTLTSTALGGITFGASLNGAQALTVDTAGTTTFSGAVGDQVLLASLTTHAGGTTAIDGGIVNTTGAQSYNDAVTFGAAAALSSQNGGAIAFANTVHTDALLTISTAGSATFSGIISGSGGLTQNGAGSMTLVAINSYTGATTVNAGTLMVEGSIATSSLVTVNGGATLGGTGTTGAVKVESGGTLAGGASPGVLHTGDLLLSAGAILQVELAGGTPGLGGFDQIDVTGSVTLTGAVLNITLIAPYLAPTGNSYIIIDNDGDDAVIGTFSGLGEGATYLSGGNSYRVTYQGGSGNDVALTALNDAPVLASGASVLTAITEDDIGNAGHVVADFRRTITDADGTSAFGIAVTSASDSAGHWQYQLDGTATWTDFGSVDADHALLLRDGDRLRFLPDAMNGTSAGFTYRAWDGSSGGAGTKADTTPNGGSTAFSSTENSASLTVSPLNDAPAQAANAGLTLAEGSSAGIGAAQLAFADVDSGAPSPTYTLTTAPAHGKLFKDGIALAPGDTFTQQDVAAGLISYSHDGGEDPADAFGFSVSDGLATVTGQTFAFTVTPVGDAPVAQGEVIPVNEDAPFSGALHASDPDSGANTLTYSLVGVNGGALHGKVVLDPNGSYTYTPDQDYFGTDSFTFRASDGSLVSGDTRIDIVVQGINDIPVLTGAASAVTYHNSPVALSPAIAVGDVDSTTLASATVRIVGGGFAGDALAASTAGTGIAAQFDASTGTLALSGTDTLAHYQQVLDSVTYQSVSPNPTNGGQNAARTVEWLVNDGTADSAPATTTITIDPVFTGAPDDDSFTAPGGNSSYAAGTGIDTVTFAFKLTDATVSYQGNQVIVDTASSHTVLSGFEIYKFDDGTVNNNDSDVLVDDLFYYSRNHDVWNAGVEADTHFHSHGWKEGRDPDAFFSLSTYLSIHPDVKGTDPLVQFDQTGWKTGADPSIFFDTGAYLAANPDVEAAGIDPLAHFLGSGAQEGRQPIAPAALVAPNGFDYVHYLQQNPDVAAAGVDPFWHFQTTGWKEGRDPNGYFDTAGYLANNPDVAAALVNPLDHYNQFGWHEDRDPSTAFDTTDYLAANPDVAAAQINPLWHFLQSGQAEGRVAFNDGVWG